VLWQKSVPVADPSAPAVKEIAEDLHDTLLSFRHDHGYGRGIAAPQVGVLVRVIVVDAPAAAFSAVLINPEIIQHSNEELHVWDFCFSIPGLVVQVERFANIVVEYLDLGGEMRTLEVTGDLSELLQHEIDHLDGVLMLDRAVTPHSVWSRAEWERQRPGA
jgi:peptide deformylase